MIIVICLFLKLHAQQSIRSISKSISIWIVVLGLECKAPAHTTIHTWLRKAGYYRLNQSKDSSSHSQWLIFIDESMSFGGEKLLLIMGVDIRTVNQANLSFTNSSCLFISSKKSWKGETIAEQIKIVEGQLHGRIRFGVVDRGVNIKKALEIAGIPYINDLTHEIALSLRQLYENSPDFKAYAAWAALLRFQLLSSKNAYVIPPKQRTKARFHNIEPLFNWGKTIEGKLKEWEKTDKDLYEKFKKITEFKDLLQEICSVLEVIKKIKKQTCKAGIKRSILPDIFKDLSTLKQGRPSKFAKKMSTYFQQSIISQSNQNIPICSSDLIESAFGKYKLMMSGNQWNGITDLALAIPAFMGKMWDREEIKTAFEQVKIKDIKQWANENMEVSILKKRRKVFQKSGQKTS